MVQNINATIRRTTICQAVADDYIVTLPTAALTDGDWCEVIWGAEQVLSVTINGTSIRTKFASTPTTSLVLPRPNDSIRLKWSSGLARWEESTSPAGGSMLMNWRGPYSSADFYYRGDVVIDEGWQMVANKSTQEKPSPTPSGPKLWASGLGDTPTWTETSQSFDSVFTGQRYIPAQSFLATGYRFWAPTIAGLEYSIISVADPGGPNELANVLFQYATSPVEDQWFTVALAPKFIEPGDVFDLILAVRSPGSISQFNATWSYKRANGDPGSGETNHQNNGQSIRFHHTDKDSGDQQANLETVQIGDSISGQGITWTVSSVSQQGNHVRFGVTPSTRIANEGDYLFTFTTQAAALLPWVEITDHYLSNAAIRGFFNTTTFINPSPLDDDCYGIDLQVQDFITSNDWDIVSAPGN